MTKVLLVLAVVIVVCTAAIAGLFRYEIVVGQIESLGTPFVLDRWTGHVMSCVPVNVDAFKRETYFANAHNWRCENP